MVVRQLLSAGEPWAVEESDPCFTVSLGLGYEPERPGAFAVDGDLARPGS